MTGDKQKIPPPKVLSIVICDQVITDENTRKSTLVGVFDNINALGFPVQHSWLTIFCQLTNGRGKIPVVVRLIDMQDDEKVLEEFPTSVAFKDPLEVKNLKFNIGGIVFPHKGEYRFQIYSSGELLGERRIICKKLEQKKGN